MKIELSRISVLVAVVIAAIVLIYLGYENRDNPSLAIFGIGFGSALIIAVLYLWY